MLKQNLVYFGSPEFSSEVLDSLLSSAEVNIVAVVTQPDKPTGRKHTLTPSPVAQRAGKADLPIFKPSKLDNANLAHLKLLKPDIFLVVSYGKIIPISWLELPTLGTFNIHFSLLPKYRGALCISEAIRNMDDHTGVTLMKMDQQLDHGPVIAQEPVDIEEIDDVASLTTKLTQAAKQLLADKLPEICAGNYHTITQNESRVTYTAKTNSLNHQVAFVAYEKITSAETGDKAREISALIRSLTPEPGAWTRIDGKEIKIIKTHLDGHKLTIDQVQLPGKSPISWKQFAAGHLQSRS